MSLEDNKAVVRRYVAEVLNAGNLAVVDDLFDEHIVYHEGGRQIDGREAFKQGLALGTFTNIQATIDNLVAEGDEVAWRWTLRAIHSGPLMGVAPTGKEVTFSGLILNRLAGGKVIAWWGHWDAVGLLQQLGATITPPGPGTP